MQEAEASDSVQIPEIVNINGVTFSGAGLIAILNAVTCPNPRRWYRFARQGDVVIVEAKEQNEFNLGD